MRASKIVLLIVLAIMLHAAVPGLAGRQAGVGSKSRVAVVTGGHGFDEDALTRAFSRCTQVDVDIISHETFQEMLRNGSARRLGAIVLFNHGCKLNDALRSKFENVLQRGTGLLVLHHAIIAYPNWPRYFEIIGGRYFHQKQEWKGEMYGPSKPTHDVDFAANVMDVDHPITRGLHDFSVHDETYKGMWVDPDNTVLVTTDHETADPELAWARTWQGTRVAYIEPGHGPSVYKQKPYQKLVAGAIHWVAAERDVTFEKSAEKGKMNVRIEGQEAFAYQYGPDEDLAHYWPVRSPSGASMTVQHPDRFPHHRSFWFADELKLDGHEPVNFYNAWYTREKGTDRPCPFRHRIRHQDFIPPEQVDLLEESEDARNLAVKLDWEMNWDTTVLSETREMQITPLGDGEYFLDIVLQVTATNDDVTFTSDWVHYAWPYIRMNNDYNVNDGGGRIVSSTGGVNKKGTNGNEATWVDYSAPSEDGKEGLAIFSHPDNRQPHRWLTRDYGCFGPRRVRKRSGTKFKLQKGESLTRRAGVLVHRGGVESGRVAERYEAYIEGDL